MSTVNLLAGPGSEKICGWEQNFFYFSEQACDFEMLRRKDDDFEEGEEEIVEYEEGEDEIDEMFQSVDEN